jgi:ribonuclease BN (tRNA processing enzyme)
MDKGEFEKLEKLNAQIDVWIDEENSDKISHELYISRKVIKQNLDTCFPQGERKYATHDDEWEKSWKNLLTGRVTKAGEIPLTKTRTEERDLARKLWPYLFYAKWLRAKIQQNSYSDCYIRRLDDVVVYLERHYPSVESPTPDVREQLYRLSIIYLLELSATSLGWESMGYSERARRLIKEAKQFATERAPYEFYELWARYNIGVAYFHIREYRSAVLEFNKIIWQVRTWQRSRGKKEKENLEFFNDLYGQRLLLVPAKLYRAEVQLKLQLAYHSHETLEDIKLILEEDKESIIKDARYKEYLEIRLNIIDAQAYQQLGRLHKSRECLNAIYTTLFPGKKLTLDKRLNFIKDAVSPVTDNDIQQTTFSRLCERFLDVLIEDYLNWLKMEGEDIDEPPPSLAKLLRKNKARPTENIAPDDFVKAVDEAKLLFTIHFKLFKPYYSAIKNNAENRRGYFQQLAKYLNWLSDTAKLEKKIKGKGKKVKLSIKKVRGTATDLYRLHSDELLEEEAGLRRQTTSKGCPYCSRRGIDLARIEGEHYEWFTQAMFEFFDVFKYPRDKKQFAARLLLLGRKAKDDLRINDLMYRYKYWEPHELLEKLGISRRRLCWPEEKKPFPLLGCTEVDLDIDRDTNGNLCPHYIFQNIMDGWREQFLRYIDGNSYHERSKKDSEGFYFVGLQRWNSSSPAKGFSVGGGCLLYHLNNKGSVDLGIAIDPGFDFVHNLFHSGYSLDDIDIVVISHAHPDHIRDFESIVILLYELKKRSSRNKRIHVILSLGAYKRLEHIVEDPALRYFVEPYIVDIDREIVDKYFEHLGKDQGINFVFRSSLRKEQTIEAYMFFSERIKVILNDKEINEITESKLLVTIKPTRAYHTDGTYSDSFGFLIKLEEQKQKPLIFGYTGDTKWVYPNIPDLPDILKKEERLIKDVTEQYSVCDTLLVHLGSLIKMEPEEGKYLFKNYDEKSDKCERLVRDENHPYLIGLIRLLNSLSRGVKGKCKPLVLIGEFGEELRGNIRVDLVRQLQNIFGEKLAFLPLDVGINVKLGCKGELNTKLDDIQRCACKVECVQCKRFVEIDDADFKLHGVDDALYCVCKTCTVAIAPNILSATLTRLYDEGIEVRTLPESAI